jgi:NAD(P)H-hydrate repair Nnr-like enzyme with NAD(P)H-hydrate dehydratase domain
MMASFDFVPALSFASYKGQSARVLVVGGSGVYHGAPILAASAAQRFGADFAYIHTDGNVSEIRSASPDFIVSSSAEPGLWEGVVGGSHNNCEPPARSSVTARIPHVTAVLVGCGLGCARTDTPLLGFAAQVARDAGAPLIIDGDAISQLCRMPLETARQLMSGRQHPTFVTPNFAEFMRLYAAFVDQDAEIGIPSPNLAVQRLLDEERPTSDDEITSCLVTAVESTTQAVVAQMASILGVYVVLKGPVDVVGVPTTAVRSAVPSSVAVDPRRMASPNEPVATFLGAPVRCSGQGDVFGGVLAVCLSWASARRTRTGAGAAGSTEPVLAVILASAAVRRAAGEAFADCHRGLTAADIVKHLSSAAKHIDSWTFAT